MTHELNRDMIDELEELLAEKRLLEQKIRELKNQVVVCGRAKLDIEHYPTTKPDEWGIYVKRISDNVKIREVWRSIIRDTNRQRCIDQLDFIIADLQGLRDKLKEGE